MFNPREIKKDFPILSLAHPSGKPLVYLDSAATSQKPRSVITAISTYYQNSNANIHRGIHFLGDRSTKLWHESRKMIASFFGAEPEELVLVRNTTEALNFVALGWAEKHIHTDDVVIATQMDHHSNLVPWQELAKRKSAILELVPVTDRGELDSAWLRHKISQHGERIKLLALPHVSNTLGTINPIGKIIDLFPTKPTLVIDGAQAAPHMPVDFHSLGVDFYAISAHKMLGPMGIGGLFVKKEILASMDPWLFGGGMIDQVEDASSSYADDLEDKFTAGTPDVAGVVGWAAAVDYLSKLGMEAVFSHDQELVSYTLERLKDNTRVEIAGPTYPRCGSVAFVYKGVHAHDVAQILDSEGIAVRSGHHCTMPLHTHMGWAATTRISFTVYSTKNDIDRCIEALKKVERTFG